MRTIEGLLTSDGLTGYLPNKARWSDGAQQKREIGWMEDLGGSHHVMPNGGKIPSVEHHVILSFPISSPSPLEIHPSLLQSVARTV